jgi:hypothetical protein
MSAVNVDTMLVAALVCVDTNTGYFIHERRRSGSRGVTFIPFIKTVFDILTRNTTQRELSIGKNNLSLQALFYFTLVT